MAMEEMGDFEALLHNESLGPLMAQAMKELPEVNCTHPNPIQASVHIFAKIIDAKHAYTAGHSQRVARYSVALGQELGLIEEKLSSWKWPASCMISVRYPYPVPFWTSRPA